jgi:hypothetical protein
VLLQDKVLEVQPELLLKDGGSATGGSVHLASGGSIEYDWLVVSLGAAADPRGVPGVRENARPFVSLEDAEYVAQQLSAYEARVAVGGSPATVAVVGAGYAGVELAAVVGERLRGKARVVLLTPGADILEAAPAGQREAAVQVRVGLWVAPYGSVLYTSAAVCIGMRSNNSSSSSRYVQLVLIGGSIAVGSAGVQLVVACKLCALDRLQHAAAAAVASRSVFQPFHV